MRRNSIFKLHVKPFSKPVPFHTDIICNIFPCLAPSDYAERRSSPRSTEKRKLGFSPVSMHMHSKSIPLLA